jgi:hypothetical protein
MYIVLLSTETKKILIIFSKLDKLLGEAPMYWIYATAQKYREMPMGQQILPN